MAETLLILSGKNKEKSSHKTFSVGAPVTRQAQTVQKSAEAIARAAVSRLKTLKPVSVTHAKSGSARTGGQRHQSSSSASRQNSIEDIARAAVSQLKPYEPMAGVPLTQLRPPLDAIADGQSMKTLVPLANGRLPTLIRIPISHLKPTDTIVTLPLLPGNTETGMAQSPGTKAQQIENASSPEVEQMVRVAMKNGSVTEASNDPELKSVTKGNAF